MATMVITGTRKGIGRHLAEHYLAAGWRVYGCSRDRSDLQHPHYAHAQLDVGDERAAVDFFARIKHEAGGLDAVINNAGIASMNHAMLTPAETVARVLSTNVLGTFLFCREGAKLLRHAENARIVNFSTVAVPLHLPGEAVYAASKSAVVTLTQILAHELAPFGITVNAVGPTPIRTDLTRAVPDAKLQALIERQAIKRWGEFADVRNAIDFFLRPESSFVTGQVVYLGGIS